MSSVSEIMSEKEVVTIASGLGKTAQDIANLMTKKKVGSVIVVDKKVKLLELLPNAIW